MPICVTALCGRVSVQAQAGFAPAAIIPKEAVPIDPKQERHISMQSAKSPETAATSARKKNGKKKKNKGYGTQINGFFLKVDADRINSTKRNPIHTKGGE